MNERKLEFLHPEVFNEVWKRWSVMCAEAAAAENDFMVTDEVADELWVRAVKIVDLRIRFDWDTFQAENGLGVYQQ